MMREQPHHSIPFHFTYMLKSPRLIHASNSTRPYTDRYNVASVYDNNVTTVCPPLDELTDEQIDALIDSQPDVMDDINIFPELSGDDYANAVLADLNNF